MKVSHSHEPHGSLNSQSAFRLMGLNRTLCQRTVAKTGMVPLSKLLASHMGKSLKELPVFHRLSDYESNVNQPFRLRRLNYTSFRGEVKAFLLNFSEIKPLHNSTTFSQVLASKELMWHFSRGISSDLASHR